LFFASDCGDDGDDAVASTGDELQPSAADEQPPEDMSDTGNSDPVEGGTSTAADNTDARAEQASAEAAVDTQLTHGAAVSTSSCEQWPRELPFQVQITYTDLDGAEAVRVLTQTQPVTHDRQQAETSTFLLHTDYLSRANVK